MSSVTLFISLLCLSLHCTGVERMHICTYPCHAHACSFALRLSSVFVSLEWARLCHAKAACFHFILMSSHGCWLTWRLDDLVFYYFTLVAELRSSAMSGATDRREEEHVPQFYGRIDEKFAGWETDVRLWQVEFKLEDRGRLGPRLYLRGLHGQPKIKVRTKLGTQDVSQFAVDNIIQCLKDNGYGELPEELGQEALDNYFDMRQGKAESILDYIFRGNSHCCKDTAIDLDEKIKGYWLMRTSNLTEREISGIRREEVRDDLREAGDSARPPWWIR